MINFIVTVLIIALTVYLIGKGYSNTIVFLAVGFLCALGVTIATGKSVAASSGGNIYLDIFEALKEQFTSAFASTGMSMIPIYGYSIYMNKINAGPVLGEMIAGPISKAKNPYFVGVFLTVLVCGLMRIAIVSAIAIMALFISTLYPALLRAGISRASAISAIFIGTCFDWGPADFTIAQFFSGVAGFDQVDYFLKASLPVLSIVLLICAATTGVILQRIDKKSGYVFGSDAPKDESETTEKSEGLSLPKYYALLPLLPLLFILMFSPLFFEKVSLSVLGAVMISLIIVVTIEWIRKRGMSERIKDLNAWINGMGEAFSNMLVMVIAVQYFAAMLGQLNGFTWIVDLALGAGFNGYLMIVIYCVLMMAMAFLGSGAVVGITLAPTLVGITNSLGISFYSAALPMQMARLRCFNVGSSVHMQYTSKAADTTPASILKRCMIPSILIAVVQLVVSLIIL